MADRLSFGNQLGWPHSSGQMRFPSNFGLAATPYNGSLTSSNQPVSFLGRTQTQQDEANKWYMFFGFNPRILDKPAEFDYNREFQNLPEAYKGNNPYISQIIITQITADEQWVIREALPLVKWEGAMRFDWERWIFNDHRLNRRPEQAVSRMVTSRRDTRSETITAYGIAGMLEHGFMNTPKGRLAYAANLKQFINAALETMIHGGQLALLSVDYSQHLHQQIQTPLPGKADVRLLMERELRNTALLQKAGGNGIQLLINDFKETFMRRMGKYPNYLILGHGGAAYANNHHELYVPTQNLAVKDDSIRNSKMVVREWRPVKGTEDIQDADPGRMNIFLGRMFKMTPKYFRGKVKPRDFTTGLMSRKVQNLMTHDYDVVQYGHYLRCTGLYAPTDGAPGDHRPRNPWFFGGPALQRDRGTGYGDNPRWQITRLGEVFMEGCENWYDYMRDHGVLNQWTESLLARSPVVQNLFLYDVCRYSRRNAGVDPDAGLFFGDNDDDWDTWINEVKANAPPGAGVVANAAPAFDYKQIFANVAQGLGLGGQQPANQNKAILKRMGNGPRPARLFASLLHVLSQAFGIDVEKYNTADLTAAEAKYSHTDDTLYRQAAKRAAELAQVFIPVDTNQPAVQVPVFTDGKSFVTTITLSRKDVNPQMVVADVVLHQGPRANRIGLILRSLIRDGTLPDELQPEGKLAGYAQGPEDNTVDLRAFQSLLAAVVEAIPDTDSVVRRSALVAAADSTFATMPQLFQGRFMAMEKRQGGDRKDGDDGLRPIPPALERQMKEVLYEFEDAVRAIYSKYRDDVFAERPEHFVRLMNWLYEAYTQASKSPAGATRAAKKQQQSLAFEAMNLLLSELYLGNIKSPQQLFSAPNLGRFEREDQKDVTLKLLITDLKRISRLRAKLGSAAHSILARLIPDSISQFMRDLPPTKEGLQGQRDALSNMDTLNGLQTPSDIKAVSEVAIHMALRSLSTREGDILFFSEANDLWPLVSIVAYAPSGEFEGWTAVALRAYGEAGNTIYGHQSLEMGDDPAAKVHTMHYTLYQKPVISEPRWVEHRDNVMVTRYLGGWEAMKVWDPLSDEDRKAWQHGDYQHKCYFSVPLYPDEMAAENENVQDMLGRPNPKLVASSGDACPIMGEPVGEFWGIQHGENPLNRMPWVTQRDRYSTVCFEQHQLIPQPVGNGTINPDGEVVLDAGHFGPDFGYPGSSRIFTGERMYLERPNYHPASYRPVAAGYAPVVP